MNSILLHDRYHLPSYVFFNTETLHGDWIIKHNVSGDQRGNKEGGNHAWAWDKATRPSLSTPLGMGYERISLFGGGVHIHFSKRET